MCRDEEQKDSREDNKNSSTLRSKSVLNGHFHVIESDVCSTSGRRVTGFDRLGLNPFNPRNKNDSETIVGLATCGETVEGRQYLNEAKQVSAVLYLLIGVHAASNPLLGPVNDPVLPVLGLLGVGLETKHVRSGVSLGNGEANEFLSGKDFGKHFLLQFLGTEVHDGWETDNQTAHDTCTILFSSEKVRTPETPDHRRNHDRHNGRAPEM